MAKYSVQLYYFQLFGQRSSIPSYLVETSAVYINIPQFLTWSGPEITSLTKLIKYVLICQW
ncbi:hypothetical protein E2C01_033706 [Portunus trituberculatus]|uniref:Uncharacterized protein n=1 Tax=Portunus trituberculatus TaxID=210409 RepID=A0A5B7EZI9_PORTR|nr:hypothetical protein [Portunus trituberculatus]